MIRALLISLLFCIPHVNAQDTEKPSAEQIRTGDTFEVFMSNPLYTPISTRFDITQTNMQLSQGESFDIVIPARSRTLAFTAEPSNPQRIWRFNYHYTWYQGDINAVHDSAANYDLPFERGKAFKLIQGYNGSFSHFDQNQYALDFDMPVGTPVTAAREGTVVRIETSFMEGGTDPSLKDKANVITILHSDNTMADYVHLSYDSSLVTLGQQVQRGDVLGYSGNVGYSTTPHLHFHVYQLTDTSGNWQTLPVRFIINGKAVELQEGQSYRH